MFRSLFVWISLVSVGASRLQSLSEDEFGASCDDLQNRFHDQVQVFRSALETRTSESVTTQARFTMRMYGVIRTLRRAQECSWVVENDSDDIEDMRSIIQELLAGNPCGEAARSELEAGASAEASDAQWRAIPRALSILMSNECEAEVQLDNDATEGDATEELQAAEEQLQDGIDEVMDAEEEGEGAFIQMNQARQFGRFMRGVGVFFLMLFLLLACVGTAFIIVTFLVLAVQQLLDSLGLINFSSHWAPHIDNALLVGVAGGAVGLVGCAHQLYTNLLPRLQ